MAGTGHPLVTHLVGTLAVERLGGGLGLGLRLEHCYFRPLLAVLSGAGSSAEPNHETANSCEQR